MWLWVTFCFNPSCYLIVPCPTGAAVYQWPPSTINWRKKENHFLSRRKNIKWFLLLEIKVIIIHWRLDMCVAIVIYKWFAGACVWMSWVKLYFLTWCSLADCCMFFKSLIAASAVFITTVQLSFSFSPVSHFICGRVWTCGKKLARLQTLILDFYEIFYWIICHREFLL